MPCPPCSSLWDALSSMLLLALYVCPPHDSVWDPCCSLLLHAPTCTSVIYCMIWISMIDRMIWISMIDRMIWISCVQLVASPQCNVLCPQSTLSSSALSPLQERSYSRHTQNVLSCYIMYPACSPLNCHCALTAALLQQAVLIHVPFLGSPQLSPAFGSPYTR